MDPVILLYVHISLHPFARSTHVTYGHDIPDLKSDHCRTNSVVIHVEVEKSFIALGVSERVMDDAERIHRSRGRENPGVFIIHRRLLARCPNPPPRRKITVQKLAMMPSRCTLFQAPPPCMRLLYVILLGRIRIISIRIYCTPAQKRDELVGHNQWRNYLVTRARKQFDTVRSVTAPAL